MLPKLKAVFFAQPGSDPPVQPVRNWLRSLTDIERREIGGDIQAVQYGWPLAVINDGSIKMTNRAAINTDFVGQDFDEFLAEEGIASNVQARAIKKVVVALLENLSLTHTELAKQMQTSRTQIQRLLDPSNTPMTLGTLQRAADVAGQRLVIGFEEIQGEAPRRRRAALA